MWLPPPDLTVSAWADRFRRLSSESSAEPGAWRTDRAAYQRGIMDAISDPAIREVWVMKSAQVGWTEILNNCIGFHVHQDPAPMLLVQPTLEMAESWSKDRLAPMVRDTPALTERIADPKSRDSGNTLLHKKFTGGHLTVAGANSPAGLASRPIRVVLFDEVDRYPASAGTEGDPLGHAARGASDGESGQFAVADALPELVRQHAHREQPGAPRDDDSANLEVRGREVALEHLDLVVDAELVHQTEATELLHEQVRCLANLLVRIDVALGVDLLRHEHDAEHVPLVVRVHVLHHEVERRPAGERRQDGRGVGPDGGVVLCAGRVGPKRRVAPRDGDGAAA